ncbi:hypothetical protein RIF29_36221 [Crotalaria pallida]|uniref:Uncharacterized protein n=1 Tax=Crotalaria pallida TaxID=3830 RepID=A0AAN9HU79_CROPI
MAEAIIQVVLENLSSLLQNELRLFLGFDQDLKRLCSTLTAIKATLEDAEEKQFSNRAIKDWLQKLKEAAWVLDDILDECATHALELESEGYNFKSGLLGKVQSFLLSSFHHPKHVVFRRKIAEKLKKIRERLDEIAEEKNQFHFIDIHHTTKRSRVMDWRETTSTIQPKICGREEEKDKIVDFLVVDASNVDHLSIFTILGMGGLGKTTLAQLIFNHDRVVNHFELRIWVCVSEDFSLKKMAKAIIQSASGVVVEDLELEPLQRRLQELLRGKRYLLVLDDVWDDDQDNWERLKNTLTCGAKGASVLVTTRLTKVASIMGTTPPHRLSLLSENDCWELFKQRAFEPNEVECVELMVIGKEIVKKCKGVPLAAKALGSLLRFKRDKKEWLYVKESKLWSMTQDENSVMPALRLSYLNLPIKLRPCFALCALFPKDTRISKHLLIDLWVANGFISSDEMLEVEDIGEEVLNELHWRSFFQDIETDIFGRIKFFKMHDLVHDLSQSVAEEVCHITYDNVTSLREGIRHLLIHKGPFQIDDAFQLYHAKSLKTCIFERFKSHGGEQFPPHVFRCYSLRVLQGSGLINLPPSIGNLKHLRYLNLSYGNFKTLPESLCMLFNLHILKLECCLSLQKLPNRLKCLKALRHLYLGGCYSLSSLPPKIGELTSLRTLNMYIVGKEEGFLLAELRQLNIKGELHIKQLEKVKSVMDAKDANMASKQLNKLALSWGRNQESQLQGNVEQIIEMLQPQPQHLQKLGVGGYRGVQFPQWMGSPSLRNLNSVKLLDCEMCLDLPPLGKLPSLKILKIANMNHVKYVDNEAHAVGVGGFMALEFLIVERMPNLIRLSREEGESMFQNLSVLQITDCPKLVLPCLPSLKELRIKGKYNQDMLSSVHKFYNLENLQFVDNDELTCFPYGMLGDHISLKTLEIYRYSKLEVLPLGIMNINAMQKLFIKYCDNLEPLTEQVLQGLHSLKILEIVSYPKFNFSSGFQYLTSLEKLLIEGCPKVESLHEALQHMTSLQSLQLCDLPNLVTLPNCLGNLALLHSLLISNCP